MSKRQGPRVVDLEIETLGADGFGVAQFERHPVHVKGALPVSGTQAGRRWSALSHRVSSMTKYSTSPRVG